MNQETPTSRATESRSPMLERVDFVPDSRWDRRLFASQLVKKKQRFRRLIQIYVTTGVITLTALAFLFD